MAGRIACPLCEATALLTRHLVLVLARIAGRIVSLLTVFITFVMKVFSLAWLVILAVGLVMGMLLVVRIMI